MAKPTAASIIILSLVTIPISIPNVRSQLSVSPILPTACPGLPTSAKITVYTQANRGGSDEDFYYVTQSPITPTPPSNFGVISVNDDKLTAGPDYNSREVGREQGTLAKADLSVRSLAMNTNYYFTEGIYNGSTISVLGRNPVLAQQTRELSVVGGTGIFRCARGYLITNTYSLNPVTLNDVYEYNFYVSYYTI